MSVRFMLNETSYFGKGAREELPEEIRKRGFKKVLVVTDKALAECGVTARVTEVLDKAGIDYAKTAVGDKYVYEYMKENGCRIGGEQSGHIIFIKYASTGDGILTSLKLMEVMMAKKMPMSKLYEGLKIYPQLLVNIRVKDKTKAQNDIDVQNAVKEVEQALGDSGRILVRESGTEPLVRVMVEAETHEECEKYVYKVIDVIKEKGHEVSL